ncbi:extensin-1-like [Solanum tuberosum]|nr:PREDICTED: extensin-1-like [Solanum tuberosum]
MSKSFPMSDMDVEVGQISMQVVADEVLSLVLCDCSSSLYLRLVEGFERFQLNYATRVLVLSFFSKNQNEKLWKFGSMALLAFALVIYFVASTVVADYSYDYTSHSPSPYYKKPEKHVEHSPSYHYYKSHAPSKHYNKAPAVAKYYESHAPSKHYYKSPVVAKYYKSHAPSKHYYKSPIVVKYYKSHAPSKHHYKAPVVVKYYKSPAPSKKYYKSPTPSRYYYKLPSPTKYYKSSSPVKYYKSPTPSTHYYYKSPSVTTR